MRVFRKTSYFWKYLTSKYMLTEAENYEFARIGVIFISYRTISLHANIGVTMIIYKEIFKCGHDIKFLFFVHFFFWESFFWCNLVRRQNIKASACLHNGYSSKVPLNTRCCRCLWSQQDSPLWGGHRKMKIAAAPALPYKQQWNGNASNR